MKSLQEYRNERLKDLIRMMEDSIPESERLITRGLDGEITDTSYARMCGHLSATIKIAIIHLREIQLDHEK